MLTRKSPNSIEVRDPAQHLVAHVGQDEPAASKLRPVVHQRPVVEVMTVPLPYQVALADKEVGPVRNLDQSGGPLRIAGVCHDLLAADDAQRVGGGPAGVQNLIGRHRELSDSVGGPGLQLDKLEVKSQPDPGRPGNMISIAS